MITASGAMLAANEITARAAGDVQAGVASVLPLAAVAIPVAVAVLLWIYGRDQVTRRLIALVGGLGAVGVTTAVYTVASKGPPLLWQLPPPLGMPLGVNLMVDGMGAVFGLITAFVWLAATIYSLGYMHGGSNDNRFFIFLAVVESGMLGIAYAGSLLTLLPFFELMSLMSYVLVVHEQGDEAMQAGNTYLYMSAAGGISLLAGLAAMQYFTGTTMLASQATALAELAPGVRTTIIILLSLGFAVKAGAVPLHVWLPKAHPVAPSPASALLSGVMIKAGIFGIIRVILMVLGPAPVAGAEVGWDLVTATGPALLWLGAATMLTGSVLALVQDNAKRSLAYSSISQMGYLLLGVGAAAWAGAEGWLGLAATTLHLVNHALYKSCLFLAVGAVLHKTGTADMRRLGGLGRRMPFTAFAFLVAAAAIAGIPGLNGYLSKTLLHHSITEVAQAEPVFVWAERTFILAGVATTATVARIFALIFLGRTRDELPESANEGWPLRIGMSMLIGMIVLIGLAPGAAIERIVLPAVASFGYAPEAIGQVGAIDLFAPSSLLSLLATVGSGLLLCWAGIRMRLFDLRGPAWLSVERIALQVACTIGRGWLALVDRWSGALNAAMRRGVLLLRRAARRLPMVDYMPGPTATSREFSLLNLDFDFYLILLGIAVALVLSVFWWLGPGL